MNGTRRKHSAASKAQVAIEALKEKETLSELSKRFDVHPQMISKLKQEFLTRSAEIFKSKGPDEEAAKREKAFYEKIGRLEIEVDFCTAIIDVFSRYIVGWKLSNTLDGSNVIEVLRNAIKRYGVPEIVNSDQGS